MEGHVQISLTIKDQGPHEDNAVAECACSDLTSRWAPNLRPPSILLFLANIHTRTNIHLSQSNYFFIGDGVYSFRKKRKIRINLNLQTCNVQIQPCSDFSAENNFNLNVSATY
jgi:hypothetical protein